MKKHNYLLILLILNMMFFGNLHARESDQNTDSLKIDSLLESINRRPSEAEMRWALSKTKSTDPAPYIAAGIAFLGILISLLFQIISQSKQTRLQIQKDTVDRLYDSLKWFEGDTQKRSIGIAMIEANWDKEISFQKTWVPVLINQAIYLISQSGQNKAPHEIANLKRIMTLLIDKKEAFLNEFKEGFDQLAEALHSKNSDGTPTEDKEIESPKKEEKEEKSKSKIKTYGLDLSKEDNLKQLNKWRDKFLKP